ncbi:MAG: hypothetical protein ACAH88_17405, partial [Roseimicrobium sp.]
MEGRIWAMLAAFLFIACFAGVVSYYMEIDSKQRDWAMAKADLKSIESAFLSTQSQAATARQSLEKAKAETSAIQQLATSKKELTAAIAELRSKKILSTEAFKKNVDKVRLASVGMAYPEFTNGSQTLRGARIQKIGDEDVTFAHDEGIAKIGKEALPLDLKKRFRMGMFPLLPEPPAPVVVDADGAQPPAPMASGTSSVPESAADLAKREAETKKLQNDIFAHEEKIVSLSSAKHEWNNRAADYRRQAGSASLAGRPTYNFTQQAK